MKRILLIDCNNFFVSCERVFNPKLRNKPVVVLSSNDACVIARSNEAKALGIPMGIPAYQCESIFKKHNVIVYSANFTLYGDMSNRVMQVLAQYSTDIEIYSIDEAFLYIREPIDNEYFNSIYYTQYALFLRKKVLQKTGIPISIGIGITKTLSKIANKLAKKNIEFNGVFDITNIINPDLDKILNNYLIEDIWGIGRKYSKLLKSKNIKTAKDFKYANSSWVKENMTVTGLRTLLELNGISCLNISTIIESKKSITVSRSFGRNITSLFELKEAVATYISMASEKLRAQNLATYIITVFIVSKRYHDSYQYFNNSTVNIPMATNYTPDLINHAYICLENIYKLGYEYKKAGVIFSNLVSSNNIQVDLINNFNYQDLNKKNRLINCIDNINNIWGKNKIFFASTGIKKLWNMKQLKRSQNYTTNWHELLTINLDKNIKL